MCINCAIISIIIKKMNIIKKIVTALSLLTIFSTNLYCQDKLEYIDEYIKFENDSLISIGEYFKKVSKYSYFSWEFFNSESENYKNLLFSNDDISARGLCFNFSTMKISKNLNKDYNLLKTEIIDNGLLLQYVSNEINNDDEFNNYTMTNTFIEFDYTLGLGYGYGWSMKDDAKLFLNNTTGLNIGYYLLNLEYNPSSSNTDDEPNAITRDFFKSNITYFFNKKFGISAGITKFNTYDSFVIMEGIGGKALETGLYYVVDAYLIDYLIKEKVQGVPIYNFLIQNLINYGFYSIKKNSDIFPFKGNSGQPGFQYQIGFHFKY